jgi:hypothetical protein
VPKPAKVQHVTVSKRFQVGGDWFCKCLKRLAPQVGLEPTTLRLTAGCSAIELLRSRRKPAARTGSRFQCHYNDNIPSQCRKEKRTGLESPNHWNGFIIHSVMIGIKIGLSELLILLGMVMLLGNFVFATGCALVLKMLWSTSEIS